MNVPDTDGAPVIVMLLLVHEALTPVGKPFAPDTPELEIPVAPVVVWVIAVKAVLIHKVGVEEAVPDELLAFTVKVAELPETGFETQPYRK